MVVDTFSVLVLDCNLGTAGLMLGMLLPAFAVATSVQDTAMLHQCYEVHRGVTLLTPAYRMRKHKNEETDAKKTRKTKRYFSHFGRPFDLA